ncbi:glycosyltransferase, partial [Pectobacterium versatile]
GFEKISNFYSTGSISLKQCPNFYRQIDALIFPSMLECFSATPIEAMKMNVPVYCSDYPFLRGICQNASFYFDALSSESIAKLIAETIGNKSIIHEKIYNGMTNINNLPSSYERAVAYMNVLNDIKYSNEKR